MSTKYTWKKGIFDCAYKIYLNNQQIGLLRDKTFSQTSEGEINGKSYLFKTTGFLKQRTQILNENNELVGEIEYNNWMNQANISLGARKIIWKYSNIWHSKWNMSDSTGLQINSSASTTAGTIETNTLDDISILTGLFVTNYYIQMSVVIIIATMVPIWTTLL